VADDIELSVFRHPFSDVPQLDVFSPDGRYFVIETERGLLHQDRIEDTIRIFRSDDVHQFLLHPEIVQEPPPLWRFTKSDKDGPVITRIRWLADSSGVAFLTKTASGQDQLFLADLRAKKVLALTSPNQLVTGFDIRDRNHAVYSVQSPIVRESVNAESHATSIVGTGRSLLSLTYQQSIAKFYDLSELWAIVDGKRFRVEERKTRRPVYLHYAGESVLSLSPNGHSLVTALAVDTVPPEWETLYPPPRPGFERRITAGNQDLRAFDGGDLVSEYVLIQLSSGDVKPLTKAPMGDDAGWFGFEKAGWSSDGQFIALSNTFLPRNEQQGSENKQPNPPCVAVLNLAKNHFSCVEQMKSPDETDSRLIEDVYFDQGLSDRLVVTYEVENGSQGGHGSTNYLRSDDDSWRVTRATKPTEHNRLVEISVKQSLNDPPILVATDETTESSRVIWDPNPQLKGIDLGEVSVFKWKDTNGHDWAGGLYKPPDYTEGRRYPLVIQNHGFSESYFSASGGFPSAFAARELAGAGILVLQVQDCPFSVTVEEGPCNVAGYEAAVRQLAANGLVDQERVGIVGFSRTCYYVMEALTKSTLRFKAASITDGVNAGYLQYITSAASGSDPYLRDAEGLNGVRPFGNGLQQWLKRSPEFNMDKVTTPLQVVALGRSDILFMWEPYAALRYLNKPVDLIVLTEGTHVLTNPAQRMVSQGGTVDWFRFWLKGEEDPDPAKSEQYARWRELRKLQEQNEKKPASESVPH